MHLIFMSCGFVGHWPVLVFNIFVFYYIHTSEHTNTVHTPTHLLLLLL
jgi:hypothetical protein